MVNKSIDIAPNPRNRPSTLDEFVGTAETEHKPKLKRLTFDIPADLHKNFKRACLENDVDMVVELRKFIEQYCRTK
jgi:hypothetical protein